MTDPTRRGRNNTSFSDDAGSADNNLAFVLRQASIRCLERHRQRRPKPFDKLLLIFAHYFAEVHDLPFVKILRDATDVAPKPRPYLHPHEFIVLHLLRDEEPQQPQQQQQLSSSSVAPSSSNFAWNEADIQNCLEEARMVADAVDADQEHLKQQHKLRSAAKDLGDAKEEEDDDESASKERALLLVSYFRIAHDILDAGLAVSSALRTLHPEIADEAASLVSRAGPQLPRAIATMEALSRSETPGADAAFYAAVAKIGKLLLARHRAEEYVEQFRNEVDDDDENETDAQKQQQQNANTLASKLQSQDPNAAQTIEDVERLMQSVGEKLDAGNEHAFNEEVQLVPQQTTTTTTTTTAAVASKALANNNSRRPLKPERFAKVVTGYGWNNYNKAHYSFENPPPKMVQAYEFTLFYPQFVDPKNRTPRFAKVPTEMGERDEYCYLEFDAGEPYQKVAYRIVNREWDRVKATFDPSGKFKLYFKFKTTNYKR